MSRRPASATLATVALVAVLAVAVVVLFTLNRGGDDQADDAPTTDPTAEASDGTDGTDEAGEPEPLVVPAGVTLTVPGTRLAVGDPATVAWEPRQDQVGALEVAVEEVQRTTFEESFSGWQLDAGTRGTTPYFVRAAVTNVGDTDLGGRPVPLYGQTAEGPLVEATNFATRFNPCPGNGSFPREFAGDDTVEVCLVFLVPDRGDLSGVTFRPTQDFEAITWTAPEEPQEPQRRERGQRDRG